MASIVFYERGGVEWEEQIVSKGPNAWPERKNDFPLGKWERFTTRKREKNQKLKKPRLKRTAATLSITSFNREKGKKGGDENQKRSDW